jgi:hypothetical protein
MNGDKLNLPFDYPTEEVESKIGFKFNEDLYGYDRIIPLRSMKFVKRMAYFERDTFEALIRNIPLRGDPSVYPYKKARIEVFGREPKGCDVGQTFILESKLISLICDVEQTFSRFFVKGLSKMPPVTVYGADANGEKAMAFYIPPIIEIHQNQAVILDGIHRNCVCKGAGTTINSVHISEVDVPLPFDIIRWKDTQVMKEKPSIEQRYVNLRKEYFRHLGAIGIDG